VWQKLQAKRLNDIGEPCASCPTTARSQTGPRGARAGEDAARRRGIDRHAHGAEAAVEELLRDETAIEWPMMIGGSGRASMILA